MTRKISLTTGLAVAALTLGVQTALAQAPDVIDRAVAARQSSGSNLMTYPERPATLAVSPEVASRLGSARQQLAFDTRPATLAVSPEVARLVASIRKQDQRTSILDRHDRAAAQGESQVPTWSEYRDAFERYVIQKQGHASNVSTYRDSFQRSPLSGEPVSIATSSSGRDLEWPQLGIGFGLGMIVLLGLILAVRLTRSRPLAHG